MRNNLKNVQYLLFVLFMLTLTGCGASNLAGLGSNNEPGNITAKAISPPAQSDAAPRWIALERMESIGEGSDDA